MTVTGQMQSSANLQCRHNFAAALNLDHYLEWYMSEMSTTLLDSDMTYLFHDLCTTSLTDCHSQ